MEKSFEMPVVPRIIKQTTSNIGDLVSRFQFQGKGCGDWLGLRSTGRGLEIDIVLGQFRRFLLTLWSSLFVPLLSRKRLEEKREKGQESDEFHGRSELGERLPKPCIRWRGEFAEIAFLDALECINGRRANHLTLVFSTVGHGSSSGLYCQRDRVGGAL